ncbi:GNAT family N-acetyltransferase [Amycolatopsis anabasis]|uniref:GNAT family N-acetyltransferase n=1 Tax=Amycolatopsis anabasis TaxID=1840409 RepID=UPI0015D38355|nr:GNAT family N-acetyltransferase [Amycolatopsis anabasis]
MEREIRPATRADIPELARVLALAFHDDPFMRWILPGDELVRRRLPTLFGVLIRHQHFRHGACEVAVEGRRIVGGTLWDPPGSWRQPLWRTLLAAPGLIRAFGRRTAAAAEVAAALEKAHPYEPHWFLAVVGTDPDLRGKGIGGDLLRSRLDRCDAAAMPAYLESSKESNIGYYEKFGFAVTREITVPGGGPTAWAMWREPR